MNCALPEFAFNPSESELLGISRNFPALPEHRRAALLTAILYASALFTGATGWSGITSIHWFALLYPFIYLESRRRRDTFSAGFYYAASTWSVVPGAHRFFALHPGPLAPLTIWFLLVSLSTLPWVLLYRENWEGLSALLALISLALPPLGLLTVVHPLIAAGRWFPGTHWAGLLLPLVLIASYKKMGKRLSILVLLASAGLAHARHHAAHGTPGVVAINTHFGPPASGALALSAPQIQEQTLQALALAHPGTIVLFPEAVLPTWTPASDERWTSIVGQLNRQHTAVLVGTDVPIPGTYASRNILLSRGYSEHLSYVQRIPVPLGMWHIGHQTSGYPLMLSYPSGIRIWNQRAAVLICWEQLLVWPALQSLASHPALLLAPSNLYWASDTPIPAIQHISVQDWAALWGIPLYEATNR